MVKILFLSLLASPLLSGRLGAQNNDALFLTAALTKLQHAKEYTLKTAEAMPGERYNFKPTPEEMSFGEQLLHLASNLGWLTSEYLSQAKNPVSKTDAQLKKKEDIIAVVGKTYDYAIEVLKQVKPEQLSDTVRFFAGPLNKLQILNLINDHQTHHRAQLLVYLRLNGIKPPDYIGW